jgi:hypothetical protein
MSRPEHSTAAVREHQATAAARCYRCGTHTDAQRPRSWGCRGVEVGRWVGGQWTGSPPGRTGSPQQRGGGGGAPPHQLHHQTTYGLRTATVRLAWVDTLEDRRKIKDPAFATIRGGVVMRGAKGFCPLHTKNVTLATSYRQPAAAGRPTPHATSEGI